MTAHDVATTRSLDHTARPFGRARWVVLTLLTALVTLLAPAAAVGAPRTTTNPVSSSFADSFADPSIIQAKDGWWYAYSTADPLKSGDEPGIMHIARTRDFVTWKYLGTVFNETNRPSWAAPTSGLWAPDVRYIGGQYVLYYTVTDTTFFPGDDSAIGVATAPTPAGPWTPSDEPVVRPRPAAGGGFLWTFDPAGFTDVDGQRYVYYGSYFGGLWVTKMSADGLTAVGTATQVAIDNRYEGAYVVRHGGWYYLMGSAANCCAGPTTGYSVFTGRSRSPVGPFVDADGISLMASAVGGTALVTQNGNRWIGAGHHAIATDATGRDFVVYHAIDSAKPWLNEPGGVNRRPMLIDRIDWIDGWPRTRAGAGPSASPQDAPVTGSALGITAANPAAGGFKGLRQGAVDPQAGATARVRGTATTRKEASSDVRVRVDLRGNRPLLVGLGKGRNRVHVTVDPRAGRIVVAAWSGKSSTFKSRSYAADPAHWQTLVVEVDRSKVTAQVSDSDLGDPSGEVRLTRKGLDLKKAPVTLSSIDATIDNVTIRPVAREAKRAVPVPRTGRLLAAQDFNDASLPGWSWVRRDSAATVAGGALSWPLTATDLTGTSNNAGVLLTTAPRGDWIVETKLTLDLGKDEVRNFQQAGLVAYRTDDDFARLSSVAIFNTRQTEFLRELSDPQGGALRNGGAVVGTPAPTTWLRLAHQVNKAGEHVYRAGVSRDGKNWTWGAAWNLGAGTTPKIGIVAHGGDPIPATASFDYVRFYAAR